ncbi:cobalt-zinc-cadmium efflux system outer membrane protein [Chitinophaga skermanii]|uniref:Cobalt-zinc-cadmium efflux system outer membrane protein n=1 Tax=Chitinophaga skermanii TaxID=331697 RepID=A0A327QUK6_9BACT|nr:TolC family protein [Chitinophaga skermanii]RAJ05417.1 cobalt-zinc-cadmium efflux system outer membrane protein [Chitinophaga skermanii]
MIKTYLTGLLLLLAHAKLAAQDKVDTVRLTPNAAEKIFLDNNLPLLAEKLNIKQGEAKILQAKAWPNPTFTLDELQVYKNATTEDIPPVVGNFWRDRNFAFQFEQLILTARKRQKNISLETRNKEMAEIAFTDLLYALKAEFRQTMFEIQYLQQISKSYQIQLIEVNKLLAAQEIQFKNGHTSQAELFRLKGLAISLKGELNEHGEELNALQKSLKSMMNANPHSFIILEDAFNTQTINHIRAIDLAQVFLQSSQNTKLIAAKQQVKIDEAQLAIEKANRVPDVNLIANFDRAGSTMRNFVGLGFSVDIPAFNRNKGNIRAAQFEVQKSNLFQQNTANELQHSLVQHFTDLQQAMQLYTSIDTDYMQKLDDMTSAIGRNFAARNISLLEFLDYYESFRDSKEQYYGAIKDILIKKENLNYLVGGEL